MTAQSDLTALRTMVAAQWKANDAALATIIAELAPTPPPPPPTQLAHASGLYPGFSNVAGFTAFEGWLGAQLGYIVQMGDTTSDSAFESSVWGQCSPAAPSSLLPLAKRVTYVLSVPLAFGGQNPSQAQAAANLAATNAGAHDGAYQRAAGYVKAAGFAAVVIRFWEGDGVPGWMPWSSVGNEPAAIAAHKRVAGIFRATIPGCRIDYCGTLGFAAQYQRAYPGDAVVDICGLDCYDPGDLAKVTAGLTTHVGFATAHGKPWSLPEWGLESTDNPGFVDAVLGAAVSPTPAAYNSYFNENTNGAHTLATFPKAQAAYKARVA